MKRLFILALLSLTACQNHYQFYSTDIPPVMVADPIDDSVVVSRAVITIQNGQVVAFNRYKPFKLIDLIMPKALAYTGSTPPSATVNITYTNAVSSSFSLTSGSISTSPTLSIDGLTLDFGAVSLFNLDDNKLKVCGGTGTQAGVGTTKCNTAIVRVYASSGDANGVFCNSADAYCVPMKVNGNVFGVGAANAQNVSTYTIPTTTNRLLKSQLGTTSWPLVVDMTNAGAGSYSATIIVEYVLKNL
jgi:hypothetical protein